MMAKMIYRPDMPNYTIDRFVGHSGIVCKENRKVQGNRTISCIELPLIGKTLNFNYNSSMIDFLLRNYVKYSEFLNKLSERSDE